MFLLDPIPKYSPNNIDKYQSFLLGETKKFFVGFSTTDSAFRILLASINFSANICQMNEWMSEWVNEQCLDHSIGLLKIGSYYNETDILWTWYFL